MQDHLGLPEGHPLPVSRDVRPHTRAVRAQHLVPRDVDEPVLEVGHALLEELEDVLLDLTRPRLALVVQADVHCEGKQGNSAPESASWQHTSNAHQADDRATYRAQSPRSLTL